MLVILVVLAVTDLVVGVSNDAVNFLNSAVGSKAVSLRTILIVASLGIGLGAVFSSGMMEVARKGIFNPGEFYFDEIMIIFTAVMIADVLLLDFFNTLGLPTSTTVSIVFDLLGASVAIAFLKLNSTGGEFNQILTYINTDSAIMIVVAIFLSVGLAFTVGAIVQYLSRLVFSFQYEQKIKYIGSIFGGVAITAITFFILLKGLKGIPFIPIEVKTFISGHSLLIIVGSFVFWTLLSQIIISVLKVNILKVIIIIGTFALALSFAGNDLVNFIGVPIAAWHAFEFWSASGVNPSMFLMTAMAEEVQTPSYLLIIAGAIMVLALVFSKKSRHVMQTELNLSRQDEGKEKFKPNFLSRLIVRYSIIASKGINLILPKAMGDKIDLKFQKPQEIVNDKQVDAPMFDMVRASVNLVVASILIAIGTSYKLPLSTTYVTFMVAMGTSLADRAWDRESAVYRVAGVFNVIGGWFMTAISAFSGAAIIAIIIWYGGIWATIALFVLVIFLMVYSAISHKKKMKIESEKKRFNRHDILSINEITEQTSENISSVINGINKRYGKVIDHLGYQDLAKLKKDNKKMVKLEEEVEELKDNVFYFIKSLQEDSVEAGKFYILILNHLQEMVESTAYITKSSYKHVHNNHKNLKFNQIRDLKSVDREMEVLLKEIKNTFDEQSFGEIDKIIFKERLLETKVSGLIQKQIDRIRTSETSPKNTKLYFGLLLESKDLITATINLLELFKQYYEEAKREL